MQHFLKCDINKFMEQVEIIPFHSCWEWVGKKNWSGYGVVLHDGMQRGAHRFSYELHKGEIPRSHVILHACDNRSCVRPEHLISGTQSENIRDMVRKGRGKNKWGAMKNVIKPFEEHLHTEPTKPQRGRCTIG